MPWSMQRSPSMHLAADDVFIVRPEGLHEVGMLGQGALAHVCEDGVRLKHLVNVLLAARTTQHTGPAQACGRKEAVTLCLHMHEATLS